MSTNVFISRISQVSSLGTGIRELWLALLAGKSGARMADNLLPGNPIKWLHAIDKKKPALPALSERRYFTENKVILTSLLGELFGNSAEMQIDGVVWGHGQAGLKFGDLFSPSPDLSEVFETRKWTQAIQSRCRDWGHTPPEESQIINHANACITGVSTLGAAADRIRAGVWQRALVVVQEPRVRDWVLWPYYKMNLLSNHPESAETSMRPFALDRDGFIKGEGGAAFLLESDQALQESGADPYCRIKGYALTADLFRMAEPSLEMTASAYCLEKALAESKTKLNEINLINAYGSGTLKNDLMETHLIKKVFAGRAKSIPVNALKPYFGHLNTAAAAIELAAVALMIRNQVVLPTLNLLKSDPDCDLDYVK